ncbi:hypothetical protein CJ030_MR3G015730 [Morella rubra]|uniref:Uncharacterized protein n=1 Tax=Morella rubra TaxID=262757 RepID=A0A6A1W8U0_9ROSI|nr:hypothetical protein CJ030_MR3G015730 [Morella rubra]
MSLKTKTTARIRLVEAKLNFYHFLWPLFPNAAHLSQHDLSCICSFLLISLNLTLQSQYREEEASALWLSNHQLQPACHLSNYHVGTTVSTAPGA